jgi:predicted short-subunit dehydrogenase-like oxidoreductase (DUF2520 family)
MHRSQSRLGVAIVGPGRLGQALGKLLKQAGVPILFVVARRLAAARRAVRFMGCGIPVEMTDTRVMAAPIILLTTADSALAEVATALATRASGHNALSGKVVLHTCGSLPSSVLRPLKRRGASIGSLHPFQTVPNPTEGLRNLRGCYWGIEGDLAAQRVARNWVKALGGIAFNLRPTRKTQYHLAAFLVCPPVITLMEQAERLLGLAGIPSRTARAMLARFVAEAARNFVTLGGRRALTGPAVRGDWPTIGRHMAALRRVSPEFVPVYEELLGAMLRLAKRPPPRRKL